MAAMKIVLFLSALILLCGLTPKPGFVFPAATLPSIQIVVQAPGISPSVLWGSGSLAFTSNYVLCVYTGTIWVKVADGKTICTF